jgi:hypothetical protein
MLCRSQLRTAGVQQTRMHAGEVSFIISICPNGGSMQLLGCSGIL